MRIQRRGSPTGLDTAKAAATRARVAHEHDGGGGRGLVGAAPALANVGTTRLLADGVQVEPPQVGFDLGEVGVRSRGGDGCFQPFGKPRDGALAAFGADLGGAEGVGILTTGGQVRRGGKEVGKGGDGSVFEICWTGFGFGCGWC